MSGLRSSGFFCIRSSLLPWESFLAWAEKKEREDLRAALRAWLALPEVREAIFLASPSLEESLEHWERDPASERGQKVELSLVKYFARMSARATPFGLFSGVALGAVAEKSALRLAPRRENARATRLDGELLAALAELFAKEHKSKIRFEPSSSLYKAAGRLRFAFAKKTEQGRSYDLLAVEPTPHLEAALEAAKGGALLSAIGALVAERAGVSREEGTLFAERLAERGILVPEIEPFVTGEEPLLGVVAPLRAIDEKRAKTLEQVRGALRALDEAGLGQAPSRYRALAQEIATLGAPTELPRLFQVDMVKKGALALSSAVLDEVQKGVSLLHRITETAPSEDLERWKQEFQERFEGREVPLALALDEESGIGLGAPAPEPLLRGLALPSGDDARASFGPRESFLLEKLLSARRGEEFSLSDADVKALEVKEPRRPLPEALAAVFTLEAPSAEALDRGEFRYFLGGVQGPSGAALLGRFGHADPSLLEKIRAHLEEEEALRPRAVFAEVVHLPEGRLGNVIFRPVLRGHEIPFLGRSGGGERIPIQDLLVSVAAGRIVLRSRSLEREVVPRITCAFNLEHRASQPLHRFLGMLQYQDVASSLGFQWGALASAPWLPRVVHGKCVLALARWDVRGEDVATLKKAKRGERAAALHAVRERLQLPRRVALADYDNLLPLDLENPLSQDALFQLVKERASFTLTEIWPEAGSLPLEGEDGHFHHEIVAPFVLRDTPPSSRETPPRTGEGARSFAPGSSCAYFKLYTGAGTADLVLKTLVQPVVQEALALGLAERWFFLRYRDPRPHLRLRFFGPRALELVPLLHARAKPFLEDGRIARLQLDTYERELERYGGDRGVSLAEEVFAADSACALALVQATPGDQGADLRWRLLVRGVDQLLEDLGFALEAKRAFAKKEKEGYGAELGAQDAFWRQLGQRFRRERASLEALLDRTKDASSPHAKALAAFALRSERLRALVPELRALPLPLEELAQSYVHLHANRLLRTAQRAQEACLHYFLERLYEAESARARP